MTRARLRRAGVTLVAAVLAVPLGACGAIGEIRRTEPRSPSPAGPTEPEPLVEHRRTRVDVPPGARLHQLEFEDAARGYALYLIPGAVAGPDGASPPGPTDPDATAVLFGTVDGGRSWQPIRHPQARGFQQLYAGGGVLVLFTEPDVWHVSTNAGSTFTRHVAVAAPAAYRRIYGSFQACCHDDERPKVVRWSGADYQAVPVQPPLPQLSAVAYTGSRLVAAGLRDGRPYVSTSPDGGRSWTAAAAPEAEGGLSMVLPMMAPDGDAWLVGHGADRTRFPRLWRQVDSGEVRRWVPVEPSSPPERFTSAVPLGAGLLAVTGPEGNGLVSLAGYAKQGWPVGGSHLRMLGDGTLFAVDQASGEAWFGLGTGTDRRWLGLRLEPM